MTGVTHSNNQNYNSLKYNGKINNRLLTDNSLHLNDTTTLEEYKGYY